MRLDRQAQALAQAGDVAAGLTTYRSPVAAQLQELQPGGAPACIHARDSRMQWHHGQHPNITSSIPWCIDSPTL